VGDNYSPLSPTRGTNPLPASHLPKWLPLYYGGLCANSAPVGVGEGELKWQQLGLVVVLLGTWGLIGFQEEGGEGVDLVCSPNLVG
jgi:hypothetical protein